MASKYTPRRDGETLRYVDEQTGEEVHVPVGAVDPASIPQDIPDYLPPPRVREGAQSAPQLSPQQAILSGIREMDNQATVDRMRAQMNAAPLAETTDPTNLNAPYRMPEPQQQEQAPATIGSYGSSDQSFSGPSVPSFGPLPKVGLKPDQETVLDTYDIQSGVTAGARDRKAPIYGEMETASGMVAGDAAMERDRQNARTSDEYRFLEDQRGKLLKAQDDPKMAIAKGVDPNRIFSNGTVSQVQAALAGMASALFGDGGASDPMVVLNKIIDRDIDQQKLALQTAGDNAQNSLAAFERAFGNTAQAETAYRSAMLDFAEMQARALATRIGTQEAREKADMTIVGLQQEKAKLNNHYMDMSRADYAKAAAAQAAARAAALSGLSVNPGDDLDWKGLTKQRNDYQSNMGALRAVEDLEKLMGPDGSDAPGRGPMDYMAAKIPGPYFKKDKELDRAVGNVIARYQNSHSGQSSTDQEFRRIVGRIDSALSETDFREGVKALKNNIIHSTQGVESVLPQSHVNWLRTRNQQNTQSSRPGNTDANSVGFTPYGGR